MVTPSELAASVSAADTDILKDAELRIDEALRVEFCNRSEVWIATEWSWTAQIRRELIRRYEAAGWNVRFVSDRDGRSLVFAAAGTAP